MLMVQEIELHTRQAVSVELYPLEKCLCWESVVFQPANQPSWVWSPFRVCLGPPLLCSTSS